MDLHDFFNVQRMFQMMAEQWDCPVWVVKRTLRRIIHENWEKAMFIPEEKALWEKYFPDGKPTPEQYVLRLGHAHEKGEYVPYLLKE